MATVALDVDGVLLDLNANFRLWVEKTFGSLIEKADIRYWDYHYGLGIPKCYEEEMWTFMWNTPLTPYPGAHRFLQDLASGLHDIHLVSNRPKEFYGADEAALRDFTQFRDVVDSIHILNNTPKSHTLDALDADLFVDDNPENCVEAGFSDWGQADGTVLLFERRWNEGCLDLMDNYIRITEYEDIVVHAKNIDVWKGRKKG